MEFCGSAKAGCLQSVYPESASLFPALSLQIQPPHAPATPAPAGPANKSRAQIHIREITAHPPASARSPSDESVSSGEEMSPHLRHRAVWPLPFHAVSACARHTNMRHHFALRI